MNLFVLLIPLMMIASCNSCDYSREVRKEAVKIFDSHKEYITELSFVGVIYEKNICDKCKVNKYTIKIGLTKLSKKPEFSDTQYPPYYFFENDSILNITVDNTLFDGVEINDTITKESKLLTINVNQTELQYLSNDKNKWLPHNK